jgi:hypothetical protein
LEQAQWSERFGDAAITRALARLPLSDAGSATAGGVTFALMLATSRLLANAGWAELGRCALAGVERACRAKEGAVERAE